MPAPVSHRLKSTALILATLSLSGCVTLSGSCKQLALTSYSQAFRDELADQIVGFPEGAAVNVFVADSIRLRDAVRACKG